MPNKIRSPVMAGNAFQVIDDPLLPFRQRKCKMFILLPNRFNHNNIKVQIGAASHRECSFVDLTIDVA